MMISGLRGLFLCIRITGEPRLNRLSPTICAFHLGFGLGEADFVVRLGSDGRRGFVEHAGELTAPATVRAITSVMEGGVEAFERRAAFYHEVLGDGHGQ